MVPLVTGIVMRTEYRLLLVAVELKIKRVAVDKDRKGDKKQSCFVFPELKLDDGRKTGESGRVG